jgi:hypothetical protein
MKKFLVLILVLSTFFAMQAADVFADSTNPSYTLSPEDEKRLMNYPQLSESKYENMYIDNSQFKEKISKYIPDYLTVAKDYMDLKENYDYSVIASNDGKVKYTEGFLKYLPWYEGSTFTCEKRIEYIQKYKLIKKSTFVTDKNCIYRAANGRTIVRGVEYFTIINMDADTVENSQNIIESFKYFRGLKTGVEYKADVEIPIIHGSVSNKTTRENYNELYARYTASYSIYLNEPTVANPVIPTNSKILINGKAVSFQAYNINESNYFKLRDIAKIINGTEKQFEVSWDEAKNTINLTTKKPYTADGSELNTANVIPNIVKHTDSKIYMDNKEVQIKAYNIDSSNYFKLRDIAKVINFDVIWNGETNTINIDTSSDYTE